MYSETWYLNTKFNANLYIKVYINVPKRQEIEQKGREKDAARATQISQGYRSQHKQAGEVPGATAGRREKDASRRSSYQSCRWDSQNLKMLPQQQERMRWRARSKLRATRSRSEERRGVGGAKPPPLEFPGCGRAAGKRKVEKSIHGQKVWSWNNGWSRCLPSNQSWR